MISRLHRNILSIVAIAMGLILAVGFSSWRSFQHVLANQEAMNTANTALRNQLHADMMHDALRADVLDGLRAAARRDAEAHRRVVSEIGEHIRWFREDLARNQTLDLSKEVTRHLAELTPPLEAYIAEAERMVRTAGDDLAAAEDRMEAFHAAYTALEEKMERANEVIEESHRTIQADSRQLVATFKRQWILWVSSGAMVLFVWSMFVAHRIPRPFRHLAEDLARRAEEVNWASDQVAAAGSSLAAGASHQAASLEETGASLEEMTSTIQRNAEAAKRARDISTQTCAAADEGSVAVEGLRQAMNQIVASNGEVARIVKTIDEIAFQTNVLALNAAVEAARAGAAGAGFAVVADEVRRLAQSSAAASKETGDKISAAIRTSTESLSATERAIEGLQIIIAKVRAVDRTVADIATASAEQAQGLQQVNRAVTEIDQVTQANAATAEQSAAASTTLSAQASALKKVSSSLLALVGAQSGSSNSAAPESDHVSHPTADASSDAVSVAPRRVPKSVATSMAAVDL